MGWPKSLLAAEPSGKEEEELHSNHADYMGKKGNKKQRKGNKIKRKEYNTCWDLLAPGALLQEQEVNNVMSSE